jgi:pimeloyl-ACP methyl ester carboxylesterase
VVFVHGNPTWSFMWRAPVLALKGNRRAIAFDQLGMGLSGRPGRALRLADRAADLAALLGTLCPEGPVSLVGHDWGGPVALSWAVANPGRVASLCLLNTGLRVPEGAGLPRALLPFRRAGALGAFLAGPCGLFTRALARSGTLRPLPPEAREGLLAPYSRACHRKAVADFVADIPLDPRHPSWGALSAILDGLPALRGVPTLLVWGLRDFVFSEPFLRDMESLLPQSQTLALPLSGHWCLEDEPGRIVQALSGFLRDGP